MGASFPMPAGHGIRSCGICWYLFCPFKIRVFVLLPLIHGPRFKFNPVWAKCCNNGIITSEISFFLV